MQIKFEDLPIGESFVGKDDDEIKIIYERTEPDIVKLNCYAPNSDNEVMKAFITISTGRTRMKDVDADFWDITLDGEPIDDPTYQEFENLSASVTAEEGKYLVELESK